MIRASIVGGTGFVGGELARWLLGHPEVELGQVTSQRLVGHPLSRVHPHLDSKGLRFVAMDDLESCDVLFSALPSGACAENSEQFANLAEHLIDCSSDYRLRDLDSYQHWYGEAHPDPSGNADFVYGLPELNRDAIRNTKRVSGVGCNATAVQLALLPLWRAGLLSREATEPANAAPIVANVMAGTSEAGATVRSGSHHPLRSGSWRAYAPVGHRHTAEVQQSYPGLDLRLSITALDRVRGALALCHVSLPEASNEKELLRVWQRAVAAEPFLEVQHGRAGQYPNPDPKLVTGSNRAQLGFALDQYGQQLVAMCAIDNLGKGAAGSAVQCMNLMLGFDENTGLQFRGLHPL